MTRKKEREKEKESTVLDKTQVVRVKLYQQPFFRFSFIPIFWPDAFLSIFLFFFLVISTEPPLAPSFFFFYQLYFSSEAEILGFFLDLAGLKTAGSGLGLFWIVLCR